MLELERKKYMYGISNYWKGVGIVFHLGRTIVCFYCLTSLLIFRLKMYSGQSYDIFEEQYFTDNFIGLSFLKAQRVTDKFHFNFKETLKALYQQYCSRVDAENNYRTNYRVINKLGKYIPQHFNGITWEDIPFGTMWDDYSGRYSSENAKQRLYVYMGSEKKEWGGWIIFKTGEIRNETFYDFIASNKEKEDVLAIFNKYKGKTDFLRNVFPEYFSDYSLNQ